jgi:hypothetical protein
MTKKTSNDEKFIMNFFQKGNNNKQIVNVQNVTQNFSESDYIPEEDGRFCNDEMPEELAEIEKELDKDKKRLISEKIGKKLKAKGYSSKKVGPFTFNIKTREEYTAALRQTLAHAENIAESVARDRKGDSDFLQFLSMTVLYLSDLLEKVEAEDKGE